MCALVTGVQTCALPIWAISNLVRMDRIPHQRIVGEQRVVEMERAAVERAVAALGRDQPVGRDSQQPFGLVGVEGDAMLAARLAARPRPGELRVEAELRGLRPVPERG